MMRFSPRENGRCLPMTKTTRRDDTTRAEDRLKAIRGRPHGLGGGVPTLLIGQTWLWRWSGLAVGLLVALVIAAMTLSPLPQDVQIFNGIDKVYHFIAFAGLIFPLILTDSRRWTWAVPLSVLFGGAIELIQPTVGRSAEWLDFGADITGVLAGAALAEILHDRIRDRFFAVETPLGPEAEVEAEAQQIEAMRAELVDELRVVLREELSSLHGDAPENHPEPHPEPQPVRPRASRPN